MKKLISISTIALAAIVMFGSCKKDKDEPKYVSEAQGKEVLQSAAMNYVSELASIQTGDFFTASMSLYGLIEASGRGSSSDYEEGMNLSSASVIKAELLGFETGTYTWNGSDDFSFTAGNGIKFVFPYSQTSTSNDCELTLTYTGDETDPLSLNNLLSTMKVKNKEVFRMTAVATYKNNDPIPSVTATSIQIEDLKYAFEQTKTDSKIGFKSSWKKGNTTLSATEVSMDGKFKDMMAMLPEMMDMDAMSLLTGGLLDKVSFSFQIMNVKSLVNADIASFVNQVGEAAQTAQGMPSGEQMTALINKNVNAKIVNTADNNNILANIMFDSDKGAVLSFGENSTPVAAEAYFANGFEQLQQMIAGLMGSFDQLAMQ